MRFRASSPDDPITRFAAPWPLRQSTSIGDITWHGKLPMSTNHRTVHSDLEPLQRPFIETTQRHIIAKPSSHLPPILIGGKGGLPQDAKSPTRVTWKEKSPQCHRLRLPVPLQHLHRARPAFAPFAPKNSLVGDHDTITSPSNVGVLARFMQCCTD